SLFLLSDHVEARVPRLPRDAVVPTLGDEGLADRGEAETALPLVHVDRESFDMHRAVRVRVAPLLRRSLDAVVERLLEVVGAIADAGDEDMRLAPRGAPLLGGLERSERRSLELDDSHGGLVVDVNVLVGLERSGVREVDHA